ncbi:MAG: hypothetical protein ACRDD1_10050, partial [Planctomycetia bacterium]
AGGDEGAARLGAVVVSAAELARPHADLVLQPDAAGVPQMLLDGDPLPRRDLLPRLLLRSGNGGLETLKFVNRLPRDSYGEWEIDVRQTLAVLPRVADEEGERP